MLLEMVPVVASCVFLPFIHESPRFLMLIRKDADGARASLEYYRKSKEVDAELNEMEAEGRAMETLHQRTIRQMFASDIRKALIICCMLQANQAVLRYQRRRLLLGQHLPTTPACLRRTFLTPSSAPTALNVVMTIVAVPLMDVAGRRKLLLIPIIAMIVILSCLTVCLHFQHDHPFTAYISIVCILIYVVAFAVGLGPISVGSRVGVVSPGRPVQGDGRRSHHQPARNIRHRTRLRTCAEGSGLLHFPYFHRVSVLLVRLHLLPRSRNEE